MLFIFSNIERKKNRIAVQEQLENEVSEDLDRKLSAEFTHELTEINSGRADSNLSFSAID